MELTANVGEIVLLLLSGMIIAYLIGKIHPQSPLSVSDPVLVPFIFEEKEPEPVVPETYQYTQVEEDISSAVSHLSICASFDKTGEQNALERKEDCLKTLADTKIALEGLRSRKNLANSEDFERAEGIHVLKMEHLEYCIKENENTARDYAKSRSMYKYEIGLLKERFKALSGSPYRYIGHGDYTRILPENLWDSSIMTRRKKGEL